MKTDTEYNVVPPSFRGLEEVVHLFRGFMNPPQSASEPAHTHPTDEQLLDAVKRKARELRNTLDQALNSPTLNASMASTLLAHRKEVEALETSADPANMERLQELSFEVGTDVDKAGDDTKQQGQIASNSTAELHALAVKMEELSDELEKHYKDLLERHLITQAQFDEFMEQKRRASLYPEGSKEWEKEQDKYIGVQQKLNRTADRNARTPQERSAVHDTFQITHDYKCSRDEYHRLATGEATANMRQNYGGTAHDADTILRPQGKGYGTTAQQADTILRPQGKGYGTAAQQAQALLLPSGENYGSTAREADALLHGGPLTAPPVFAPSPNPSGKGPAHGVS